MPLTPGEPKQETDLPHHYYDRWYVAANGDPMQYLHSDSVFRQGTFHAKQPLGWYASREDALAAIERWREKQEVPSA